MGSVDVVDVAAGLVFRNGRLLITQRPPGSHLAGLWEFPGGKLQQGESWEAALTRELQEELGFVASVGSLYQEITHAYPEKTVRLRFHLCQVRSGEPTPIECSDLAWVDRAQLGDFPFPPADEQLLVRLGRDTALWITA